VGGNPDGRFFVYRNEEAAMTLRRSRSDKMIAGICGGIARAAGWDPTTVRVGYVVLSILSAGFPGVLVYLVLWAIMPREPLGTL
jgi:phage shock protein C